MITLIALETELYGLKHLLGLLMMLGLSAIYFTPLIVFSHKLSANGKLWVLRGTALFLWLMEMIKFIILLNVYGYIPLGEFPFHLCSMPLYLFPLVAFGKSKFSDFVKPGAFVIGLIAGAISILYPSNILGGNYSWFSFEELLFPLRSFVFHTVMIFFSIYMLMSKHYTIKAGDLRKALIVLFSLAAVAITLNGLIPAADFFLLGHGYGSPLAFLIDINRPLYILAMLSLGSLVVVLIFLPFELKKRNIQSVFYIKTLKFYFQFSKT